MLGTFHFSDKKNKKKNIFFYPKSYFFCDLKPHAKFHNPTIQEREKNAVNSSVTAHAKPLNRFSYGVEEDPQFIWALATM